MVSSASSRYNTLVPLAAVQAVGTLCGVLGVRWLSAVVPPETMGLYGLLLSTQQLGFTVTHQGFIKHIQRFWTPRAAVAPYLRLLLGASTPPLLWLAAGLTALLVLLNLTAGTRIAPSWWGWMMAVNLLAVVLLAVQAALQAEERYWANFAVSAVASATRSFFPPLLVTILGGAVLTTLGVGFFLHVLVAALFAGWCLRKALARPEPVPAEPVNSPREMVRAFMSVGLCGWVAGAAPRWFAALVLTPESTGYFILATNLAMFVPAAASLIGLSYSFPPLFAASRGGADQRTLLRMTNKSVASVMLMSQAGLLALAWCGPFLVGPIVNPRYAPAMGWMLAAGGSILATLSLPFYCNSLIAHNQEHTCFRLSVCSASFRIAVMAALAADGNSNDFRLGLVILPWPTVALEWWLTRYWLGSIPPTATSTEIEPGSDSADIA